jgi:3-oxoacyl-[acyl-carrier protein] reductase
MTESNKPRVAVITGAGQGIGFAIARQLLREGCQIVLNDVDPTLAKEAADHLSREGPGKCIAFAGDAGNVQYIQSLVRQAVDTFGRLDIAVANAGITHFSDFFEVTEAEFQKVVDVNLKGAFFLMQQAARQMRQQGQGGKLLLISSTIGMRAYPKLSVYSTTKAGLQMMARSLVQDLSPHGININVVAPGATLTERTRQEDPDYPISWGAVIPNGNTALPEDIAGAASFLLSENASHITGQTLTVDGGWTTRSPYPGM